VRLGALQLIEDGFSLFCEFESTFERHPSYQLKIVTILI
jgi:hypothetical protein